MLYLQVSGAEPLFFQLLQWLFIVFVVLFLLRLIRTKPMEETHRHQYRLFDDTALSTQDFYQALTAAVAAKEYPQVQVSRVTYFGDSLVSGNREYLRIQRFHHTFDVCAAPFGKDFFISWWIGEVPSFRRELLAAVPWIGRALERAIYGKGLYVRDAEVMFRDSITQLIEEAINATTNGRGIRGIQLKESLTIPAKEV